jgi:hypothetical protein
VSRISPKAIVAALVSQWMLSGALIVTAAGCGARSANLMPNSPPSRNVTAPLPAATIASGDVEPDDPKRSEASSSIDGSDRDADSPPAVEIGAQEPSLSAAAWVEDAYRRRVSRSLVDGWRCPKITSRHVCSPVATVTLDDTSISRFSVSPCGSAEIDAAAQSFASKKLGQEVPVAPAEARPLTFLSVTLVCR